MFDWNDLRHFLATARAGTTLGAAKTLGASQSTVVRRLAALEEAMGVHLFDRGPAGYALTAAGRALLPLAERVEADAQAVADACEGLHLSQPGAVRFTVPELLDGFLFPAMCEFRRRHPDVQLQVLLADRPFDILRGEADLALRSADGVDPELFARRMPDACWTAYASRSYAAQAGLPDSPEALNLHPLIGGEGFVAELSPFRWMLGMAPDAKIVWRCNSLGNVQACLRAGLGISMLPCASGGADPDLVACFPPPPEVTRPLWLITRPELRRRPDVRALLDTVTEYMETHRALFTGLICADAPPTEQPG